MVQVDPSVRDIEREEPTIFIIVFVVLLFDCEPQSDQRAERDIKHSRWTSIVLEVRQQFQVRHLVEPPLCANGVNDPLLGAQQVVLLRCLLAGLSRIQETTIETAMKAPPCVDLPSPRNRTTLARARQHSLDLCKRLRPRRDRRPLPWTEEVRAVHTYSPNLGCSTHRPPTSHALSLDPDGAPPWEEKATRRRAMGEALTQPAPRSASSPAPPGHGQPA